MAFLGRAKREDLKLLAEELGEKVTTEHKIVHLKKIIVQSKEFDEEFVKEILGNIIAARLAKEEEQKEKEKRLLEEQKEARLVKEEEQKEARLFEQKKEEMLLEEQKEARLFEQKKEEMLLELERLKIEMAVKNTVETGTDSANRENEGKPRIKCELQKIMQKFDPKEGDISLYLTIFERQARRAQVNESDWVSQILGLLPYEIVQLIAREPEEEAENYEYVKRLLLKRFKLSPEKFRQKFVQHQRGNDSSWRDFIFELKNYFEEWITGLGIKNFEELKNLMITDQLKRRVPNEIREHFLDDWPKLVSAHDLAERLDEYESVRGNRRRTTQSENQVRKGILVNRSQTGFSNESGNRNRHAQVPMTEAQKRNSDRLKIGYDERFETRRKPQCYECGSYNHFRPQCPKLVKNQQTTASMNRISEKSEEELLQPYTIMAKVNGYKLPILRDSGATIDVVCYKYVTPDLFTGETVWVKQPLDLGPTCLPLARITLSGDFGDIVTKAAVISDELDQGRYLLGNRTAALLSTSNFFQNVLPESLNAVQTRSQKNSQEQILSLDSKSEKKIKEGKVGLGVDETRQQNLSDMISNEEEFTNTEEVRNLFPPETNDEKKALSLIKISSENFAEAQKRCDDLESLFKKASRTKGAGTSQKEKYVVNNDLLFKSKKDHLGEETLLLVVPKEYRGGVKSLCHEGTSAHLGVTKTKDRLLKYFFWPKCYKEVEDFVRSCDACQRAGKSNERKKAPLKLVPVIEEVFSKINVDAVGPLPITPTGKRYVITTICLASKYPDAVAVTDIGSVSVIEALLQIFSRIGFPREIQCDQGTSFMSALTTEFFERFRIKVSHSSVHHPQSNPVERFHRTIKRVLRVLCWEAGPDWERHLHSGLFALRTVTHESTGFSPAELVHGKNLRTPVTLLYEHWIGSTDQEQPVTEHIFNLINRLKKCQELAVQKMEDVQVKRKKWYDKNAVKREFKKGDLVLVLATSKPNKLALQWIGPGTVLSQLSETNYIVQVPGRKEHSQIFHINMLKPYYKRPEWVNLLSHEESEMDLCDPDINFPYWEANSDTNKISEIIQESNLEKKLNSQQINELETLLNKYLNCFSNEPGKTHLVVHDIELKSDEAVRAKPYRTSPRQNEILKTEIQRMLDLKIIERGESDYTSPMILIETPQKEPRPCIDYRKLNKLTRTQFYPLPNIEDRVETVAAAKYITVLDMAKGYWQIPLSPKAQRLAAFVTNFGIYRPLRMPFGLKNAPYFFSQMMSELLRGCEKFAVPYIDDVAIFSNNWIEHLKHLEGVLQRIKNAALTIKPSKCRFAQDHVLYLGHVVGQGYRKPAELKVRAIKDFPTPTCKTQIRSFLGLAGYYSRYIPMFSATAAPLTELLKGKTKKGRINWNENCEVAFSKLKNHLSTYPVLYAPDFQREFLLQTDSSDSGMGVVLAQVDDHGTEHPIIYLSKKFSDVEKRYGTTEKECAAIVFAVKKLQCYLDGQNFKVQTDHNPLIWLNSNASSNPKLMRWALTLQPYTFEMVHRPGIHHKNVDSLSRSFT